MFLENGIDTWIWRPITTSDVVSLVERRVSGITGPLPWGYQPQPQPEGEALDVPVVKGMGFLARMWSRLRGH